MGLWLTLHVLGVLLMVGNIITAAFWKSRADRTGNPQIMHNAAKNVMVADYIFTIPGLVLIVLSGGMMTGGLGYSLTGLNWLTLSLGLFAVSGLIWLFILIPMQSKMIRLSADGIEKGNVSAAYRRASRNWTVYGTIATLLPLGILYLMISKGF